MFPPAKNPGRGKEDQAVVFPDEQLLYFTTNMVYGHTVLNGVCQCPIHVRGPVARAQNAAFPGGVGSISASLLIDATGCPAPVSNRTRTPSQAHISCLIAFTIAPDSRLPKRNAHRKNEKQ